ncbi:diacylglycerol kinase delta-like isoform X1 [Acropora muricata]|uniref:diacylglycerol kinase delta-like isoform X1 n=1 Tax=Acropora muricata TaxID=159855 RepID=UPI0034E4E13F
MAWRRSYDFTLRMEESEFDSSDESDSEGGAETINTYHRRKSTVTAVKSKSCIKEGFLLKQTGSFQRWKRRYFKLIEGNKLFYAKSSEETVFSEIDLQDFSVAASGIKNDNNSFSVITAFQNVELSADSRKEMDEWICALKSVSSRTSSRSDLLDILSGGHNWYSCSHSKPTFCNVCRDLLSGVTSKGLSCEVCRFKVHRRCAVRAKNNCKWTTVQSVRKDHCNFDESDPLSIPHQWLEGNLPPSAKCSVCDQICGSKRRLQGFRCLWCNLMVHQSCQSQIPRCSYGDNALFTLPPVSVLSSCGSLVWNAGKPSGCLPMLVFVNSKSGDNQGVKFIRKFKQLLNPIQVFDLALGGPSKGLKLFKEFEHFRILVCGGDGSVGWVMNEVDQQNLSNQCQLGVLPLGTGNDLSRVLGWGTSFVDDNAVTQFLQHLERAKAAVLDRWSIMIEERPLSASRSSSIETLDTPQYRQEFGTIDMFENNVATHLTRILHSSKHSEVISSARVLCETVKDFVSKVGTASANSEPWQAEEPDSLTQKCTVLNEKLNLLLNTLSIESEALSTPSRESLDTSGNSGIGSGKPRVFVSKEALMSRANSLKKALKHIIEHAEKAVDEQNAQTSASTSSLAEAFVTVAVTAAGQVVTTSTARTERGLEPIQDNEGNILNSEEDSCAGESDPSTSDNRLRDTEPSSGSWTAPESRRLSQSRCISKGSSHPFSSDPMLEEKLLGNAGKPTVQFSGCIISRAFLKERPSEGLVGSWIGRALLANADALCAAASPMMNNAFDVEGYTEKCVMNNYFGIGLDAKIALDFHLRREEHPEKFRHRALNLLYYGLLGGRELLHRTYKNLDQRVRLECDGHKINLPSLQGIVVLNITSYMGGANFWGTGRDDGFMEPSNDDNILEVVAVLGASQMGMSKVFGGMQHHRIAQCRVVKISIFGESVPVQVDGEAWMQSPGYIKIVHKNRTQMLVRDREFETTLKEWTEIQQEKVTSCVTNVQAEVLTSLVHSLSILVNSVKTVCESRGTELQDLSSLADTAATSIERLVLEGKIPEAPSKGKITDLVTNGRTLLQGVSDFLHSLSELEPPVQIFETERNLWSAISTVRSLINKTIEAYALTNLSEEEVERQGSNKAKGKFKLGFLRSSKKPEMTKVGSAPSGRMIQFWGVEEVGNWLESLGLSEYKELFAKHDIRGPELLALDRPDLKDLGVTKVGHIKRILHGIKALCGGVSPKSAARIERTPKAEEKAGRNKRVIDKEDSH